MTSRGSLRASEWTSPFAAYPLREATTGRGEHLGPSLVPDQHAKGDHIGQEKGAAGLESKKERDHPTGRGKGSAGSRVRRASWVRGIETGKTPERWNRGGNRVASLESFVTATDRNAVLTAWAPGT